MTNTTLLLSMPGGSEWLLVILVVLIFFGGKKIPELMRGVGRGIREFNDAKTNVKSEIEEGMKERPNTSATAVDKDEEIRRLRQQLEQKQV
jgi:sec-independent protein translocase protein TatA